MNAFRRWISFFLAVVTVLNLASVGAIRAEAAQTAPPAEMDSEESVPARQIPQVQRTVPQTPQTPSAKSAGLQILQADQSAETYPTILGFSQSAYEVYLGSRTTISFTLETTQSLDSYQWSCSVPDAVSFGEVRELVSSSVSGPSEYTVSVEVDTLQTGAYTITADVVLSGALQTIRVPLTISARPISQFTNDAYTVNIGKSVAMTLTYYSEEPWDSITWSCDDPNGVQFSQGTSTVPPGEGGTGEENTWWFSNMVTACRGGSYTITAEIQSGEKIHRVQARLHVNETVYSGILRDPGQALDAGDEVYIDGVLRVIAEGCALCEVYRSADSYPVTDVLYTMDTDQKITSLYPLDRAVEPVFTVTGQPVSFTWENGQWNTQQLNVKVNLRWKTAPSSPYTLDSLRDSHIRVSLSEMILSTDSEAIHFGIEGSLFKKELREYYAQDKTVTVGINSTYTCPVYLSDSFTPDQVTQTAQIRTEIKTRWGAEYTCNPVQITLGNLDLQKQQAQQKKAQKTYNTSLNQAKTALQSVNIGLSGPLTQVLTTAQYQELEGFLSTYLIQSIMGKQLQKGSFLDELSAKANENIGGKVMDLLDVDTITNTFILENSHGTVKAQCTTKYGESILITFVLDWQSYAWDDNLYAAKATVSYTVDGTLPSGMTTTGRGLIAFADLEQFGNAALDYVADSYEAAWGYSTDAVAYMLTNNPFHSILGGEFGRGIYTLAAGSSNNYSRVNRIKCPVDIYIYDGSGALCGSIVNNLVDTGDSEIYAYVNDEEKIIHLPDACYRLELVGSGDGTMDYTVEEYRGGELTRTLSADNVFLMKGKTYSALIPDAPLVHAGVYALEEDNGDRVQVSDSLSIPDSASTSEPTVYATGSCGDNATYTTYTNGVMVISGTGTVTDVPTSQARYLRVEEGITRIEDSAFSPSGLIYAELADSVTEIGKWAFGYSRNLNCIVLGSGLQTIGDYAFSYCSSLHRIEVKADNPYFKTVDGVLFSKDGTVLHLLPKAGSGTASTSYTVPEGVTTIGVDAMGDNAFLKEIILPTTLTTLVGETFHSSTALERLVVNGNVTTVGGDLYVDCENLSKIVIGPQVSQVVPELFRGTSAGIELVPENTHLLLDSACVFYSLDTGCLLFLTQEVAGEYQVAAGTTHIPEQAFQDQTGLTAVILPDSLRSIGDSAFAGCTALAEVSFNKGLETIGASAFSKCGALTGAVFQEGLTSIGSGAFTGCTSVETVVLPDTLTSLPFNAFVSCTALRRLVIPGSIENLQFFYRANFTSAGPLGSGCDVEFGWTTALPADAFSGCTALEQVTLPQELTKLGARAFQGCGKLAAVTIPGNVTSIGSSCFDGCTALCSVSIPETVTTMGYDVFLNTSLTSAGPSGSGCDLEFGWTAQLPNHAFRGANHLTDIRLPQGITEIPEYTFTGCTALESLIIPEGVSAIGRGAFSDCTSLRRLVIPASVESVADDALKNVPLTSAGPLGSGCELEYGWTTAIPDYAFRSLAALDSVILPEELTVLGSYAFDGCTALSGVVFHSELTKIGIYAFRDCTGLNDIYFEGLPPQISSTAFTGVTATAYYPEGSLSWWENYMNAYGGSLTWEPFESPLPLVLLSVPEDIVAYAGMDVAFTVVVNKDDCSYQWYESGDGETWQPCLAEGSDTDSIHFTASLDRMGNFFRCVVTDSAGNSLQTDAAQLIHGSASLRLNERTTVILNGSSYRDKEDHSFVFIPDQSGEYVFDFEHQAYLLVRLYDEQGALLGEWQADELTSPNAYITYQLEAGSAYTLYALYNTDIALTATRNDPVVMEQGARTQVNILPALSGRYLTIRPEETGDYVLLFEDAWYASCTLRDASGNILYEGDAYGSDDSLELTCSLQAGMEYTLCLHSTEQITLYVTLKGCHDYAVTVYREPSCLVGGKAVYTCTDCGYTKTEYAPAIGHSYVDGVCVHCSSGIISGGICGEDIRWQLDSAGVLTISGQGTMDNYVYDEGRWEEAPWYPLQDQIREVKLGEDVRVLGDYAFYRLQISAMVIPGSVEKIGLRTWWDFSGITLHFLGDAPEFNSSAFDDSQVTAYYDRTNPTWTADVMQNYGGDAAWVPFELAPSNPWGDNLTWSLDLETGVLTFSGEGEMAACQASYGTPDPWEAFPFTKVVFESGITSVADYAFHGMKNVTEVILPDTLTEIGMFAFAETSITHMEIPDGVRKLGEGTFSDCTRLASVRLGRRLSSIPSYCFYCCTSLTRVDIPDGTDVSTHAFYDCTGLRDIWFGVRESSNLASESFAGVVATAHYPEYSAYWPYSSQLGGELTWVPYEVDPITGPCGDDLQWSLEDGVLTISGSGPMYDFDSFFSESSAADTAPWVDYLGLIRSIRIEDGVTAIGDNAFQGLEYASGAHISGTVEVIGSRAFHSVTLANLVIPEGVRIIENAAFYSCLIRTVRLPSTLETVGSTAFYRNDIQEVHIPSIADWLEIQFADSYAVPFSDYGSTEFYVNGVFTTDIAIPDSITEIGDAQFDHFSDMTSIRLHDRITRIGDMAFASARARNMTELVIPASVEYIGYQAFTYWENLSDLYILNPDCELGEDFFYRCHYAYDELDNRVYLGMTIHGYTGSTAQTYAQATGITFVPLEVKEIASGWSGDTTWVLTDDGVLTFSGQGNMKNYAGKTEMPWYSCRDQITRVVIEDGVTRIGDYAFYGMDLERIEIPASVTAIGAYAFKGCARLDGVVLPDGLTRLGESAFYGCAGLTSIEIPASLWTVQPYTFKNCTALTSVTFHEGNLQKISDGAFYNTALRSVELPDCLDILDSYVFKNCSDLASVKLSASLTQIREASLYGTAIRTIEIPAGVTAIKPYAFKNCVNLVSVALPDTLAAVEEAAFYACTNLASIALPDAVTRIGSYAFRKCTGLTSAAFGSGLVSIGESSFYGCTGLTALEIPEAVTAIQAYAFKGCTGITAVSLPDALTTIGDSAFHTCTGLSEITIPAKVTKIGAYCFSGSTGIDSFCFLGSAPAIGTGAFNKITATASYPSGDATWTSAVMQNYGGTITWTAR